MKLSDAIESIVFAFDRTDSRREYIRKLVKKVRDMEEILKSFSKNYDHDEDAHRYNTPCRVCEADKVLKLSEWNFDK